LSGCAQDAEDLTQQTFLFAQRKYEQLREPEKCRAWLTAILRNAYRKSYRRQAAGNAVSLEDTAEPAGEVLRDQPLDQEELQAALADLPEEYRSAVILFYLEDLSYKEIATTLEIPIGTVMSRLSRGKEFLRRRLRAEIDPGAAVESAASSRS
jgi:RNA polymerase sigma-70 factor (ECF subfamily)